MADLEPSAASGFDPRALADHAAFVRRLARGLVHDGNSADELASRTFAAAVERRPDTGAGFRVWLDRVTWRLFLRERRDRVRRDRRERIAAVPEETRATVDLVAELELQRSIACAFEELTEPSKGALYLRYFRDLGPTEIAEQLGVPVGTVKSRLQRGLEALRERLDALHGGEHDAWLQALLPWIGGPAMVATKVNALPLLAAAVLVIGLGVGGFEAWRRSELRGAATSNAEGAIAPATLAAAKKGEDSETKDARATRTTVDPTHADPFATGIVVDEAGAPLADVAVVVTRLFRQTFSRDGYSNQDPLRLDRLDRDRVATTDARGRFAVAEHVPDSASFVFLKDGFAGEEWFDLSAERTKNRDHLVVLHAVAALRGRVVDRARRPVELARVTVWPIEPQLPTGGFPVAAHLPDAPRYYAHRGCQQTSSDENGAFFFASLARPDVHLSLMAAGYANFDAPSATLDTPCDLRLSRSALILDVVDASSGAPLRASLLVTDSQGTVLERAVRWTPEDKDHSVISPAGRLYVHTGFGSTDPNDVPRWLLAAKTRRLDVELHVVAAGFVGEIVDATVSRDEEPPHLRVELEPAGAARDAAIEGSVHGAKLANVAVCCLIPGHGASYFDASETLLSVGCGTDGRFELFDLPAARYRLFVRAPGIAQTWVDVDAPAHDVEIELRPPAVLEVAVKNHAGVAAANVVVHTQRPDGSRAWYAKTGANGVALLEDVLAGPLVVGAFEDLRYSNSDPAVCFPIDKKAFTDATVVEVKSGERVRVERMLVERIAMQFRFARDDGAPIRHMKCEFSGIEGPSFARFREFDRLRTLAPVLDVDGAATIDLDPGRYEVRVSDDGPTLGTAFSVPTADGGAVAVRVPVLLESGSLVGRVVDSVSGEPVVKRKVYASGRSDASREYRSELCLTDDDGRFRFDALPVGSTLVRVQADAKGDRLPYFEPDPTSPYTYASQDCTVESGRETALEFSLLPIKAKDASFPVIRFDARVTDASSGRPLTKAAIFVSVRIGTADVEVASFDTDADGRARGSVFAAENYSVSIYGPALPRGTIGPAYVRLVESITPADGVLTVVAALAKVH